MEQVKRNAIAGIRRAGLTPIYIGNVLKYPRTTVYDVCKNYDRSGDVFRPLHKPRRDRKLTSRFPNGLKRSVKANPTIPKRVWPRRGASTGERSKEASPN